MLERDHATARTAAAALARRKGCAVPQSVKPGASAEHARLSKLSGRDFDAEFARYMVTDHEKDIAGFEEQAKSPDAATAAMARQKLPDLRKHLETGRKV